MRVAGGLILICMFFAGCNGHKDCCPGPPSPTPVNFIITSWSVNNVLSQTTNYNVSRSPVIKLKFETAIEKNTVAANLALKDNAGAAVAYNVSYENADSIIVLQPSSSLNFLSKRVIRRN